MTSYKTEQEAFWAGKFGDSYIERNQGAALLASNLAFFAKALNLLRDAKSCMEFGANIGMNLRALRLLYPEMALRGIEINEKAAGILREFLGPENTIHGSILDANPPQSDLVMIKGVMIHLNPDILPQVYEKLVASTNRWLLVVEYYNPSPVIIPYRGHQDRLFKRDFAGEIMERYPEMKLVDYGFGYRRDPQFPVDDITWFLMEKRGAECAT
jgi:spore coat polysaccharide biosynthesis protein SpsF